MIPGVNTINHKKPQQYKSEVNVMIQWDKEENIFQELPMELLFQEEEQLKVFVLHVALQDIQPGQEIFLDYSDAWEVAWTSYVLYSASLCRSTIQKYIVKNTIAHVIKG
jgi:hypothetical protein